jgi:hypothetical protein
MAEDIRRLQHFVAKHHLRKFRAEADDMVAALDKTRKCVQPRMNVRVLCAEKWLYETDRIPRNHVEKNVACRIEENFWPFLDRVVDGCRRSISPKERRAILSYVAFQDARTSWRFTANDANQAYIYDLMNELGLSSRYKLPTTKSEALASGREVMINALCDHASISALLSHMTIRVVASKGGDFVIGDHPVFKSNPTFTDVLGRWNGYKSPGTEIFLPLSPRLGLLLFDTHTIRRLAELTRSAISMPGPPKRVWMEGDFDGLSLRGSFTTAYAEAKCRLYLDSGLFIPAEGGFVADMNRAALQFAERWVVSRDPTDLHRLSAEIELDPVLGQSVVSDGAAIACRTVIPAIVDDFIRHLRKTDPALIARGPSDQGELRNEIFRIVVEPAMQRLAAKGGIAGECLEIIRKNRAAGCSLRRVNAAINS